MPSTCRPASRFVALVSALALVLMACGGGEETATTTTTTTAVVDAPTTTAPPETTAPSTTVAAVPCTGLGAPPADDDPQITFVRDGRLHAIAADATDDQAACLLEDAAGSILWGPAGDKAIVDGALVSAPADRRDDLALPEAPTFTRPTGTSVIAVADGALLKTNLETGATTDVSFLARHDDVTYYPSGTHIVTAGADDEGITGIWLSTNTGTEATRLAVSADTAFDHLTVAEDGSLLTFTADHGDEVHLHRAPLAGDVLLTSDDEAQAELLATTDVAFVSTALSAAGVVAAGSGTCADAGTTTLVIAGWGETVTDPGDRGWPIGFLGDGAVLIGTNDAGCYEPGQPFDLVRVSVEAGDDVVVAEGVTAAALRIPVGEPPPPPADNPSGFV